MKSIRMAVIAAGALAAAGIGLAGSANAVPMGPNVSQTVERLQSEGFHVIVNRTGNAPLEQCAVSAVSPGQTYTRMQSDTPTPGPLGHQGIITTVLAKTVYVDVAC